MQQNNFLNRSWILKVTFYSNYTPLVLFEKVFKEFFVLLCNTISSFSFLFQRKNDRYSVLKCNTVLHCNTLHFCYNILYILYNMYYYYYYYWTVCIRKGCFYNVIQCNTVLHFKPFLLLTGGVVFA